MHLPLSRSNDYQQYEWPSNWRCGAPPSDGFDVTGDRQTDPRYHYSASGKDNQMTVPAKEQTIAFLSSERVAFAKRAFTTRRVPLEEMRGLLTGDVRPVPGDLVLATVEKIGSHTKIERPDGRRSIMFPGDEIIVCFGNRYAPDQFEAIVGENLEKCELVAGGGIASRELVRHERMRKATRIQPVGLICDADGKRLNLRDYTIPSNPGSRPIKTILVAGTSMNAGKSLTAASLVRSLKTAGHRVASIKATGTGSGGDLWIMHDAGADVVADFTDAGFASTYRVPNAEIEQATLRLIRHAAAAGCDYAVIEIADGLQQQETAALVRSKSLRLASLGMIFAAYDSMGAVAGVSILEQIGHRVLAISGMLTRAPLAVRETQEATDLPVFTPRELQQGSLLPVLNAPIGGQNTIPVFAISPQVSGLAEASAG